MVCDHGAAFVNIRAPTIPISLPDGTVIRHAQTGIMWKTNVEIDPKPEPQLKVATYTPEQELL